MVTRLGTTKVVAGGLALAVLLCWAPGSQAAVFTGSATDAANDLSPHGAHDLPDPPTSFTSVAVRYDNTAGRVDVSYAFTNAPASYQEIHAGVGLGTIQPNGNCSAPSFSSTNWHLEALEGHGEALVEGHSANFSGTVSGNAWDYYQQYPWQSASLFEWPGFDKTWNFATHNVRLIGRHYTCAYAAMWIQDPNGPAEDFLDSGPFALAPEVPATPVTPSATWLSPKDGQTVSGVLTERGAGAQNCEARLVGPVVRTENYVDGTLNDTQVTAPWSCEWDTRNYINGGHLLTVKAYDAANNVIAADTIRVTVNNPNPPPVNSPPPPVIETSPGAVVPSGSTGSQPAVTPARRFTGSMARRAVKRALARRYGRAFRLRRDYSVSFLKLNEFSWRCTVRWRYGEFIYKGKIKLRLRSDGRIASRVVLRKTFK